MFEVFPFQSIWIGKHGGRFLERDAMLFKIPGGFSGIPGEHNLCIYNNYHAGVKGTSILVLIWSAFRGSPWKLLAFDRLTSIPTGSIKILARDGVTARAKKAGSIRAQE